MRRIWTMAVLAIGCLGVMAPSCQPAETAMTITATPDSTKPSCGDNASISGTVTPSGATKRLVLQRTVGGKWVDWSWRSGDYDTTVGQVTATPLPDGTGSDVYDLPYWANASGTLHLRVRSAGGGYVSKGFYVTPGC